jgi:hypothetical protein
MKRFLEACFATALLVCASVAFAAPTIELKDGSRIQGEIQRIENGAYVIVSPSLGTVRVAQADIARIVYGGGASSAGSSDDSNRQIQQLQMQLAQDPEVMKSIMSLQSDPQIQAILSDPAIAQAIQEGDYARLLDNPKIKALESNSALRQLLRQQAH